MILVKMEKIDIGANGCAYFLTFGNIEVNESPMIKLPISEADANILKPLFSHHTKSGKFEENEKWM